MTVTLVFALLGVIIFIGFFRAVVFQRTRIPDLPALLFVGILLGPVLHPMNPARRSTFTLKTTGA